MAAVTKQTEDDGDIPVLTAICFIGQKFLGNSKLTEDAKTFGFKILFAEDAKELLNSNEEIAFVLEEFEGPIYDYLHSLKKTIFGPTLVQQLAARGLPPQPCERPLFNLSMEGVGICFNQTSKKFKSEIKKYFSWIQSMGGSVLKDVNTPRVTHLVTDSCRGKNFKYASTFMIPVMSGDWIKASWSHRHETDFKATGPKFIADNKVKPFHGAHVYFMGFEPSDFEVMASELARNGGKVCESFQHENCTHVVVDDSKTPNIPSEIREDIPVVKAEWFWTSIQMDACADERLHMYHTDARLSSYLSPNPGIYSPSTPGSGTSRKRKRRKEALQHLAANDCRQSIGELRDLSMGNSIDGSLLDDHTTPVKKGSASNLLQVPKIESVATSMASPSSTNLDLKSMSPRQRVFNELVQTETNFVNVLRSVLHVFKRPLEEPDQKGGQLLNQTELKIIFGNLPPIYDVHMKMLAEFNHAQKHWTEDFSIGAVYLKYADALLKAYPPYVNFYQDSKEMLKKCEKEPRFYAFLRVCQSKPESGRQHLADLMMHPIQRLPRVILLLTDILKQTKKEKPDHPDIAQLESSLNKIKEVLNHINEDKRKTEGQTKIFEIFSDIENCPPEIVSSHRMFLNSVDVIELGGFDELSGKGYELCLFLFSDVLEISKKKSASKGLGLRSPSTMSLRTMGAGTLTNNAPGKENGSKSLKHVNLMNLTAIKRVVDITEASTDGIFALVCRTNQELKERMFVFQIATEDTDKQAFLKILCRNVASTMCRPDPDTFLRQMRAEDLGLEPSDFNVSNFSSTYRTLQKKVNRAFSFNKTPTSSRLKRAVSSMISPLSSTNPNNRMNAGGLSSTPSNDLQNLRLASCSNLLRSPSSSTTSGSSFMSPVPPPSMPLSHSFQTPKRGVSMMTPSSPMEQDSSGFSIPKTPNSASCARRPSFKMKVCNTLLGSGSKK